MTIRRLGNHCLDDPETPASTLRRLMGTSPAADRKIAVHPGASSEMLAKLGKSSDSQTRRGVAMNPGTPKEVLMTLAPSFAGEFFKNPAFDLLLIEEPDLLDRLPVTVMKNILKQPDCPASFLRWAAHHGGRSHQLALVSRPSMPRSLLQAIADGPKGSAAEIAADRLMRGDVVEDAP
jgi:hypothetical protein